jgi:hypothetical protein
MQCSVHHPSPFIQKHGTQLLPTWDRPVGSVIVVLQPTGCDLAKRSPATEAQKQQLRQRFLQVGQAIAQHLQAQGHFADLFDPKTGYPVLSPPGSLALDDVAVVKACLGYPINTFKDCCLVLHPHWGSAVYPSVLMSSAAPEWVERAIREWDWWGGLADGNGSDLGRSEYHHSLIGCGKFTQYKVSSIGS